MDSSLPKFFQWTMLSNWTVLNRSESYSLRPPVLPHAEPHTSKWMKEHKWPRKPHERSMGMEVQDVQPCTFTAASQKYTFDQKRGARTHPQQHHPIPQGHAWNDHWKSTNNATNNTALTTPKRMQWHYTTHPTQPTWVEQHHLHTITNLS